MQEQRIRAEEQRRQELQQALEEEKRGQEERVRRMEEKFAEEKRQQQEELQRALDSKLEEQRQMIEKGFKDKAEMMNQEIKQLRTEQTRVKESKPGFIEKVFLPIASIGRDILSTVLQYKGMCKMFGRKK